MWLRTLRLLHAHALVLLTGGAAAVLLERLVDIGYEWLTGPARLPASALMALLYYWPLLTLKAAAVAPPISALVTVWQQAVVGQPVTYRLFWRSCLRHSASVAGLFALVSGLLGLLAVAVLPVTRVPWAGRWLWLAAVTPVMVAGFGWGVYLAVSRDLSPVDALWLVWPAVRRNPGELVRLTLTLVPLALIGWWALQSGWWWLPLLCGVVLIPCTVGVVVVRTHLYVTPLLPGARFHMPP